MFSCNTLGHNISITLRESNLSLSYCGLIAVWVWSAGIAVQSVDIELQNYGTHNKWLFLLSATTLLFRVPSYELPVTQAQNITGLQSFHSFTLNILILTPVINFKFDHNLKLKHNVSKLFSFYCLWEMFVIVSIWVGKIKQFGSNQDCFFLLTIEMKSPGPGVL